MSSGTKGLITRIIGPVVDVTFPDSGETPEIFNALEVDTGNGKLVLETLQQLGDGVVRCISMHATDGLSRGMFAMDTGECITIPVGEKTLGRMLNVSGDPIDWGEDLSDVVRSPIHRNAPPFTDLLAVTFSGMDEVQVIQAARFVKARLEALIGPQRAAFLGPTPLPVVKVNNRYRYRVHISCRAGTAIRSRISAAMIECCEDKRFRGVSVFAESDPIN